MASSRAYSGGVSDSSPSDRALRALADSIGQALPRQSADGADDDVPVAATVVIVRDGAGGPEVLMIERPDRGSFAGAWVFPGGKLDPADGDAADETAAARRAGARETREETGLHLDADALVLLSRWNPPPGIERRIRTWFFVAGDPGGEQALAPDEVITAEWVRPAAMLTRHARAEVTLYPPTWVTLHHLADHPDAEAMIAAARMGGIPRFETVARRGADGPMLLWHGDAEYDGDTAAEDAASRHRLEIASLPWIYTRTG